MARLVESTYADSYVLKGGVLLTEVAATAADDGVVFDAIPTRIEQIRDEEEYSGLRVHVRAQLHRAQIALKLDISTGDPISPHSQLVTMPRILGGEFTVMGHPPETAIAEKAVTILQRGVTSTRWRDYVDLRSLALSRSVSAATLRKAIEEVAKHRKIELSAPSASLTGQDDLAQQKWAAWRKKTDVEDITLPVLDDQLTEVGKFLDPVFLGLNPTAIWEPNSSRWCS